MLGKLMKYEFKATSRFMLLIYALTIVMSAVVAVGIKINSSVFMETIVDVFGRQMVDAMIFMITTGYIILNVVTVSAMFFFSINRFRVNLLGKEGYLMHTLPVKTRDNILAKNFTAVIWTALSGVVVVISYMIIMFLGILDSEALRAFILELDDIIQWLFFDEKIYVTLILLFVYAVVSVSTTYFHIYASMSAGYSFDKYRAVLSIGLFLAASWVKNIGISLVFEILYSVGDMSFNAFLISSTVYEAVFGVAYYFAAKYFMSRRLNLQ